MWTFLLLSVAFVIASLGLSLLHQWWRRSSREVVETLALVSVAPVASTIVTGTAGARSSSAVLTAAQGPQVAPHWSEAIHFAKRLLLAVIAFALVPAVVAIVALFSRAPDVARGAVHFSLMLLGMFAKTLWDALENRKTGQPPDVDPWNLVKPALVSPMLFAAVWQSTGRDLSVLTCSFAFQNGFMWQTFLGKVVGARMAGGKRAVAAPHQSLGSGDFRVPKGAAPPGAADGEVKPQPGSKGAHSASD
jgi:hypothetical protein